MIAVALRNLRHRPGSFVASFLSTFLGAALLMAFAALLDTAGAADPASADSLRTTAAVGGGWCLVIVAFAVTSTLGLAVRRREAQFVLLRRVGATGSQLRRLIVGEAAAVALLASAAAVPAGFLAGRLLLTLMTNTGQVAVGAGYTFGPIAPAAGFGVTLLGACTAGIATARRTSTSSGVRPVRSARGRRIAAVVFLLAGVNCSVLTATVMDGKGVDAMQTAGQAGIWAAIGLALLAPELLRLITALMGPTLRASGATGELAVLGVHSRSRHLSAAVMPVVLFTGIATGTVYMQGIENRAAAGQVEPDYAQDVRTLNYVVVGMITLFVAVMLVNTLIAATVARRREFAQQRLAGATRGQVTALVASEGLLVTVTGVLAGSAASLFTVLPFGSARAGRWWPEATPFPYAVIVTIAATLTGVAMIGAARRTLRGPAVSAVAA